MDRKPLLLGIGILALFLAGQAFAQISLEHVPDAGFSTVKLPDKSDTNLDYKLISFDTDIDKSEMVWNQCLDKSFLVAEKSQFTTKYVSATNFKKTGEELYVLSNESYEVSEPIYKQTCDVKEMTDAKNGTKYNETNCTNEIVDYNNYTAWHDVFIPYDPLGKTLSGCQTFKLITKRKVELGSSSVDIVPSLGGFDFPWAWWNDSWSYCQDITMSKPGSSLSNFPFMINLDSGNIDYAHTEDNGEDVRIVDAACSDGGSLVPYSIEKWNESGTSTVHFMASSIDSSTNTTYSIYFGNAEASDSQNTSGVWADAGALASYYMTTDGTDNTNSFNLSVQNGAPTDSIGKVDGSQVFDGNDNYQSASGDSPLESIEVFTLSVWVKFDSLAATTLYADYQQSNSAYDNMFGYLSSTGEMWMHSDDRYTGGSEQNLYIGVPETDIWYNIVFVRNSSDTLAGFVNGSYISQLSLSGSGVGPAGYFYVGYRGGGSLWMNGDVDHLIVWNKALSNDEIAFMYSNGMDDTYTIGAEESSGGGADSTPPNVDFIAPTASNGTVTYGQTYIVWNMSVSEDATGIIQINGTNQTATCVNATTSTYCYYNETGLTTNQTRCAFGHAADGSANWNTTNQYRCMDIALPKVDCWIKVPGLCYAPPGCQIYIAPGGDFPCEHT